MLKSQKWRLLFDISCKQQLEMYCFRRHDFCQKWCMEYRVLIVHRIRPQIVKFDPRRDIKGLRYFSAPYNFSIFFKYFICYRMRTALLLRKTNQNVITTKMTEMTSTIKWLIAISIYRLHINNLKNHVIWLLQKGSIKILTVIIMLSAQRYVDFSYFSIINTLENYNLLRGLLKLSYFLKSSLSLNWYKILFDQLFLRANVQIKLKYCPVNYNIKCNRFHVALLYAYKISAWNCFFVHLNLIVLQ